MKLRPVTKIAKKKKKKNKQKKKKRQGQKNFTITSYRQIVTSFSFFQFVCNSEQSGRRIPDA